MSSDETSKIEPTLTVTDAPPIAPAIEALAAATSEPEKIEPRMEAKAEPVPQITPGTAIVSFLRPEAKPEKAEKAKATQSRSTRFALLAACVAIAASFGAIGGSIGVAKFAPAMLTAPPQTEAITVSREHLADEVKALKETVAQLRSSTRSLNENFASLKTTVTASNNAQNGQIGKIADTLDRVEKGQTEQRKTATAVPAAPQAAAPETTGSIAHQKQAAPMVLGAPPTTLKPPVVQGWTLRRVYDGAALVEGRDGIIEVEPGSVVPGLGRIEEIRRQDGRWVMMTSRGIVVGR